VGTQSTMSIFNNLQVGTSYIYLAQIDSTNAGKTLIVDLYDPGDLNALESCTSRSPRQRVIGTTNSRGETRVRP